MVMVMVIVIVIGIVDSGYGISYAIRYDRIVALYHYHYTMAMAGADITHV